MAINYQNTCQNSKQEKPDQTASEDLDLHCLSRSFLQATFVRNFKISTVNE